MTQSLTTNTLKISCYPLNYLKTERSLKKRAKKTPTIAIHRGNFCKKKFAARYLDPRTSRWLGVDPAMGEYVPAAPINEEAKKRNGNLPGMGGVFNYVNLHVYHYAGNNPVKLVDPDGRDIHNITIFGVGAKVIGGVGVTFGLAFDSNNQFAITTNFNAGIGVEITVDTPITPSFTVTKGTNISGLPSFGPYRFETGTSVTATAAVGVILDLKSNEIIGGTLGSIGGGVDFNLTIYFDFDKAGKIISDMTSETKQTISREIEKIKDNLPTEFYVKLQEYFNND